KTASRPMISHGSIIGEAVYFLRARISLLALLLTVLSFILVGAIFFNPGQVPNTFIYSIF
ncbi:MAG: hypothetical protein QF393_12135, partial [Rhodospirillales bacterium]|nr:hypothetical protein [Rhodospirillales bacterium]